MPGTELLQNSGGALLQKLLFFGVSDCVVIVIKIFLVVSNILDTVSRHYGVRRWGYERGVASDEEGTVTN